MSPEIKNKKILVVGAQAFLRKKILNNLEKESNYNIRAMSRKEVVIQENSWVEWVKAILLDRDSLSKARQAKSANLL